MKFNQISKIVSFNPRTNHLELQLSFITPEDIEIINTLQKDNKVLRVNFSSYSGKSKTYPQLKRYFAMIKTILIDKEIKITSEATQTLDEYFKETIFPLEEVDSHLAEQLNDIHEEKHIAPVNHTKIITKRDMTVEQLNQVMNKIEEIYSDVNFNNIDNSF